MIRNIFFNVLIFTLAYSMPLYAEELKAVKACSKEDCIMMNYTYLGDVQEETYDQLIKEKKIVRKVQGILKGEKKTYEIAIPLEGHVPVWALVGFDQYSHPIAMTSQGPLIITDSLHQFGLPENLLLAGLGKMKFKIQKYTTPWPIVDLKRIYFSNDWNVYYLSDENICIQLGTKSFQMVSSTQCKSQNGIKRVDLLGDLESGETPVQLTHHSWPFEVFIVDCNSCGDDICPVGSICHEISTRLSKLIHPEDWNYSVTK